MNIILNKLDLPCDIKYVVKNFIYNALGYTVEELRCIENIKKRERVVKIRQKVELNEWKTLGVSIGWLRPRPSKKSKYNGGAYLSPKHEFDTIVNACFNNQISFCDRNLVLHSLFHPDNNKSVLQLKIDGNYPSLIYKAKLDHV
jgi:hypothetical protein